MVATYKQICPVLFGVGALEQLGQSVKEMHGNKVFCICDSGIHMREPINRVERIVEKENQEIFFYERKSSAVQEKMVESVARIAKNFGADIVLGVGGGSCLDMAKAVTLLLDNPEPLSDYYGQDRPVHRAETPLILIPTLSGSGNEVTSSCFVQVDESGKQETIMRSPNLAIVDPALAVTASSSVTAAAALETLLYAVEAYTSLKNTPNSDMQALEAIRLIEQNLFMAYINGSNLETRTKLAFASNVVGMAINDAGLHFGHDLANEMKERFHIRYSVACAHALPAMVSFAGYIMPDRLKKLAEALGIVNLERRSVEEIEVFAVNGMIRLMKDVNMLSLKEHGISFEQLIECVRSVFERNHNFIDSAPKPVTFETIRGLLEKNILYTNRWNNRDRK